MNTKIKTLFTALLSLSLLAGSLTPVLANNQPDAGITADPVLNVAHFAPFADLPEDTSVTVRVNGADTLTDFVFGETATGLSLPSGEYLVEILPTGSDTVVLSGTFALEDDMQYTVAAIGGSNDWPLELFPLVDDTQPLVSGAKLRIAHLAPFAADLGDTEVDICTDDGAAILTNVPFKVFTDPYMELPAGDYDLLIALAGTACAGVALDLPSVRLMDGDIVDVFAIGDITNQDLQVASITGFDLTPPAVLNVGHFAPFAGMVEDTSVTVRVNGADALTDFVFADTATGIELPGDEYLVEILPTGSNTVVLSGTFILENDMQYTLAAIGGANGWPLELFPMVDDTQPLMDVAKLRIAHLAPFAADLGDTEVDICTDDGTAILTNVPYKVFTDPYLELPAGDYDLLIALAGTSCAGVALDLPSVRLADGDIVDVFAIGDITNQDLQIASMTGLELTPPARLIIGHFAPFATDALTSAEINNTAVTVRVDGADALTGFKFADYTPYIELEGGDHFVEIIPDATGTVALSGTLTVEAGMDYTVAAIGGANDWPLEFYVLEDQTAMTLSGAMVRINHLAPFAIELMDTEVDICTDEGAAILTNVPYKASSDYLSLPSGDYDLMVSPAGSDCAVAAIDLPSLRLTDGDIVDVFAIGDGVNQPLQVVSTTGFEITPAKVSVGHFAPFAAGLENTSVTVRVNGADALTDFVFGELTGYVELPASVPNLVEIIPTGGMDPVLTATYTLDPAGEYTVAAIGDGSNQPLELFAMVDDNTAPMEGYARLRVGHFAPFSATDTAVDICTDSGSPVITDFSFKDVTDPYLELPAGLYDLKVTAAGSSCGTLIFDIPTVLLRNGMVASVFAVGGANEFAPTVITTPDLEPFYFFLALVTVTR
jgi:hypothetical protein